LTRRSNGLIDGAPGLTQINETDHDESDCPAKKLFDIDDSANAGADMQEHVKKQNMIE